MSAPYRLRIQKRTEEVPRWLPMATSIGAIVRQDRIIMPDVHTVIQAEDHVLVFVASRQQMPKVEKLFQVSASFF